MNTDLFHRAGLYFAYSRLAKGPQIPHVQDVLYALRRSPTQKSFESSLTDRGSYFQNVALVVAAVGVDVLRLEPYNESVAQRIIAQAILDLCAPKDKCLHNAALAAAAEVVTGVAQIGSFSALTDACGCSSCRKRKAG